MIILVITRVDVFNTCSILSFVLNNDSWPPTVCSHVCVDINLDPRLLAACQMDIPKFCRDKRPENSEVIPCLKKSLDKRVRILVLLVLLWTK